ncbi:hypothetical protein, partial [Peterkaempfera griseoplana]|uniref:hypothetical protein n=1 Tax=Peterkaempfera griseoplana TaxID=66896 RepID=UPI0006E14D27
MRRIVDWCRRWKVREWWFSIIWLWGLIPGLSTLDQHSRAASVLAVAGAAVFGAAFVTSMANGNRNANPRLRIGCFAVTTALALAYPLLLG